MVLSEVVSVNAPSLSLLLHECYDLSKQQEGFLLGSVTETTTSHVSDSSRNDVQTRLEVEVVSAWPCPDVGVFYDGAGRLNDSYLDDVLSRLAPDVVGYYKYRTDASAKPTLREKLICRSLKEYFTSRRIVPYFLYCLIAGKQSLERSTRSYGCRFMKVERAGSFRPLDARILNLGKKDVEYRDARISANDPFEAIIRDASRQGVDAIIGAVDDSLASTARNAVQDEIKLRELTGDVDRLLRKIAARHENEPPKPQPDELSMVMPIVEAARPNPEPFDFVRDLMKSESAIKTERTSDTGR